MSEYMQKASTNLLKQCNVYSSDAGEEDDELQVGESWVDWIRRTTHTAEAARLRASVPDWVEEHRRRLWRFAGHSARRTDGRWTTCLLDWIPGNGVRLSWRPKTRWEDSLKGFMKKLGRQPDNWTQLAQHRKKWSDLEADFVKSRT